MVGSKDVLKYFLLNTQIIVIIIVQNQKGVGFSSTGAKKLQPKISHQASAIVGRKLESSTSTLLAQSWYIVGRGHAAAVSRVFWA